jgi:hypothetical protein
MICRKILPLFTKSSEIPLSKNHYLPPNADKLLEYMRKLGNEKNHEIKLGTQDEVEKVIKFAEALLYFVYELSNEFAVETDPAPNTTD